MNTKKKNLNQNNKQSSNTSNKTIKSNKKSAVPNTKSLLLKGGDLSVKRKRKSKSTDKDEDEDEDEDEDVDVTQQNKKLKNTTTSTAKIPILQTKTNDYPPKIFDKLPSDTKININYGDNITSFDEDLKNYINKLSNKQKFLTKYNLNLLTIEQQYEKYKNKEGELKNLENICRLQSDYIDMVHDFRKCFEYLVYILDQGKKTNESKLITNLKGKICSSQGNNINVNNTHIEQNIILNNYIKELRKLEFVIPDLPNI
jgi:hypothetical protein